MKRILFLLLLLPSLSFATDYMMYVGMYGDCVDDEPSPIYGGTYGEYPKGLIDAQFPGGDVELALFIHNNTEVVEVYSGELDKNGNRLLVTGDVLVEFVIDRCGKPGSFKILQSLTNEQDEEALRVMESLPMFRAGSLDGYRVKTAYVAPVHFEKQVMPQKKQDDFDWEAYGW